ncbi:hypothetical protein [Paraburkholderia sp. MM6662-R1]|uniref:hypothetical protein n=1 Tax=Paraburkholderia sp. MM6662-R1 TaxID=2991066 RepID=UPI003D1BCF97
MTNPADDNVTPLPVTQRNLGPDRVLLVPTSKCCHFMTGYLVDEKLAEVTCKACGEKLNPMWVLQQLCHAESRWHELHARYQDELQRLRERQRTKCEHCGGMTRISGR